MVRASDGRLRVAIETTDPTMACSGCGCRARVKDRDPVPLADLPVFGSPVGLVWLKRRWRCIEPACPVGS
jgi:transposase